MKIETKYDHNDILLFIKRNNVERRHNTHVGIVDKIIVTNSGDIRYLMHSSYGDWVDEDSIKRKVGVV